MLSHFTEQLLGRGMELLFGRSETRRRPIQLSTNEAMALFLPSASPGLGSKGVIIGPECNSRKAWIYDPFVLYGARLPGPNMIVCGTTGEGKTSLVESYCLRQIRFGRKIAVFAPKPRNSKTAEGEWARTARAVGVEPIVPGAGTCINPLDPAISRKRGQLLMQTIIELESGTNLTSRQRQALRLAQTRVLAEAREADAADRLRTHRKTTTPRQATLPELAVALRNPDPQTAARKGIPLERLLHDGLDLADAIDGLSDPGSDLAGMIDQPTSLTVDHDAPMLLFDLSQIDPESIAMPVVMAIIGVYLEHVWIRPDGIKRIIVVDEAGHVLGRPAMARLFQRLYRFARALGVQNIAIIHHLSDVQLSPEARTLVQLSHTRGVYKIKTAKDAVATAREFGWPHWTETVIPLLPQGFGIWDVNGKIEPVQHELMDGEGDIIFTDEAMSEDEDAA